MNYLKTFENYKDYYTIISESEYKSIYSISTPIDISDKIKDIIEKKNHKGETDIIFKNKQNGFPFRDTPRRIELHNKLKISGPMPVGEENLSLERLIDMEIHELPDEWFIVNCKKQYRPKSYWNSPKTNITCYKCDQLEGLLRLLQDLDIIE